MKLKATLLAIAAAALIGCGSETPPATAAQDKAFAGGPMPADWKAKMAGSQKAAHPSGKPDKASSAPSP